MTHTEDFYGMTEQYRAKDIEIIELKETVERLERVIIALLEHMKEQEVGVRE
ncbi:MAG: hypothetical protein KAS32_15725 [Candidatus Peribacteraceae bacterium]|nr:hypothetical protein [Candidatus Peribacteraceae bacterium]